MKPNWRTYTVEEIAADQPNALSTGPFGSAISSKFFQESGVPVIRGGNLSANVDCRLSDDGLVFVSLEKAKEFSRSVVRKGDLIFTCWGTINQVGFLDGSSKFEEYIISNKQMKLTPDPEKADPQYLYYIFSSPAKQTEILNNGIGAAVPGFNLGQLKKHIIQLPPIEVQKQVAEFLGLFDRKIELNRQINQTLEQIAQAVFKSWFVDFEPVKAKIEANVSGRDPERAAMCAISSKADAELDRLPPEQRQYLATTTALFPDELVESELGFIPKGWEIDNVYKISDVVYGAPFASKKFNSEGIGKPLIRIRDLKNEEPCVFTAEIHPKGYLVQPGDIVVGMDGEFRAYLWGGELAWLNQRVCVFKPRKGFAPAFVRCNIMPCLASVEATETATTVIHLGKNDIDRFQVIIPKPSIMATFGSVVDPIYSQIVSNKQSSRTLAKLRDTLLPKLLSGEVSISQADVNLGEKAHA